MRNINESEFNTAYDILESSFISAELKSREVLYKQWKTKEVEIALYETQGIISGVITLWEFSDFVFAENFAVKKDFRNKGIGATLLRDVINEYTGKRIILEVEPPKNEIQKRRIMFYERNGFTLSPFGYTQPPLRENAEKVELLIMHTGKDLTEEEFKSIRNDVFRVVYKCNNHIR